jgi:hypothetical protein
MAFTISIYPRLSGLQMALCGTPLGRSILSPAGQTKDSLAVPAVFELWDFIFDAIMFHIADD